MQLAPPQQEPGGCGLWEQVDGGGGRSLAVWPSAGWETQADSETPHASHFPAAVRPARCCLSLGVVLSETGRWGRATVLSARWSSNSREEAEITR